MRQLKKKQATVLQIGAFFGRASRACAARSRSSFAGSGEYIWPCLIWSQLGWFIWYILLLYTVRQSSVRKHNFSVTFSLKNYELFAFFCSLISVRVETARKYAVSYFRKMYFTFMGNCVNLRLFACPKKTFFPKVRENSNWMYIFACEGALIVFVIAAYIIFLNYRQFTVRKNHS